MRPLFRVLSLAALAAVASLPLRAAEPDPALAEAVAAQRWALHFDGEYIDGPGGERVLNAARAAQFVLVGEDHGFAEVPQFTRALQRALAPEGFRHLVLEIGPLSAARVEGALRRDPAALARLEKETPFWLPFLGWREDAALAAAAVAGTSEGHALWGVDQEFILSPRVHFARLVALAPDAKARRLAQDYLQRETAAYQRMVRQHDPDAAQLTRLGDKEFEALRQAYTGASPEAFVIIYLLDSSAAIYRAQRTAPFDSNRERSRVMKFQFMARYREAAASEGTPRVLFRMGAYHMGRGLSATGQFDLGNLASELAESNGGRSYHLLVLAAGGTVNRWFPFSTDPADKAAPYAAHAEVDGLGAGPFLDQTKEGQWNLFELAPLRRDARLLKAGGRAFADLVYAYDAVLVIDRAHAAHGVAE